VKAAQIIMRLRAQFGDETLPQYPGVCLD